MGYVTCWTAWGSCLVPTAGPNAWFHTVPLQEFPFLSCCDRGACTKKQCDLSPSTLCFLTRIGELWVCVRDCLPEVERRWRRQLEGRTRRVLTEVEHLSRLTNENTTDVPQWCGQLCPLVIEPSRPHTAVDVSGEALWRLTPGLGMSLWGSRVLAGAGFVFFSERTK